MASLVRMFKTKSSGEEANLPPFQPLHKLEVSPMFKAAIVSIGLLAAALPVHASTISFGIPDGVALPNLGNGGTGGYNQLIANPDMQVAFGVSGHITSWEAYYTGPADPSTASPVVASVIFLPDPNNPGQYFVGGMDYQVLQIGYNIFANPLYAGSLGDQSSGGSNAIVNGAIFGLYNLTAKVSNTSNGPYPDDWGRDVSYLSGLPPVGTSLSFTIFGVNPNTGANTPTPRTYSYRVNAEVIPAPAPIWLLASGTFGWIVTRRRTTTA